MNCGFGGKSKTQSFQKLFSGGHLFVFVEYLCKRSPKIKTKNIKKYSSILAIVNHRNWLDDSPPLNLNMHAFKLKFELKLEIKELKRLFLSEGFQILAFSSFSFRWLYKCPKCHLNCLKMANFPKNYETCPAAEVTALRPPSMRDANKF